MIKRYNQLSLLLGVPGLILQIAGRFLQNAEGFITPMGWIISLAGTVLLLVGLAYYAKSKGRHPAWCLFALLSIIGLIVLALLKDKAVDGEDVAASGIQR